MNQIEQYMISFMMNILFNRRKNKFLRNRKIKFTKFNQKDFEQKPLNQKIRQ